MPSGRAGEEHELDAIHYGGRQILIETGRYAYVAAAVEGFEPIGYRTSLREGLHQIEHDYYKRLRNYNGDASDLSGVESQMGPLLIDLKPQPAPVAVERRRTPWILTFSRACSGSDVERLPCSLSGVSG